MMAEQTLVHPVILFDGVCNLCNSSVQFVIRRDTKKQFRFASLQSAYGSRFLAEHPLPSRASQTFILWEDGTVYTKSTAALRVVRKLNRAWPLLYLFVIIPPFIRNAVYDLVARNRYQWFGKQETCWLPSAQLQELFLS